MLKKISLAAALLAAVLPATEALASRAGAQGRNHGAYHRGFHVGYRNGYSAGYRRGAVASDYKGGMSVTPADAFGAAVLGATYGYWTDGIRTYGGDPCYRYNDRDWDFERVC